jgi:hypothetical protein
LAGCNGALGLFKADDDRAIGLTEHPSLRGMMLIPDLDLDELRVVPRWWYDPSDLLNSHFGG